MRLLLINSVCGSGSTGRIAAKIADEYYAKGWEVCFGYGREAYVPEDCRKWALRIGNSLSVRLHGVLTRLFDWHADRLCSWWSTRKFLKWAEEWKPDLLWLHNLHGYYINYELLFKWIKKHPEMEVKWNLHDCWPYTGHCSHFQLTGCERWRSGCYGCPEKGEYPATIGLSSAKSNWLRKKKAFSDVKHMTIITPSKWLANLTRQSFLGQYDVIVKRHPFDDTFFKPTSSNIKSRLGIGGRKVVLGVASVWDRRKGFEDFLELRKLLSEHYAIVMVGLNARQIHSLPCGIIGLARTNSPKELAELYSSADWFFNPTYEDIYSMTNIEAASCGCRVATYDTGGAPEAVEDYDKAWVLKGKDKSPEGFLRLLHKLDGVPI